MKIIAFIPSRYDSKRFPGKPLALISGKPMIQHVYRSAESCTQVSRVLVATDDERIFQCVSGFGGEAIMTSKRHPSGTDRIAEAARSLHLPDSDLVVNVQGDQPVFNGELISEMIRPLQEDLSLPMSTLMHRIRDERDMTNPHHVKVVTDNIGNAVYFSRYPIPFFRDPSSEVFHYRHLGFYAYRMGFLNTYQNLPKGMLESAEKLEQLRVLENGYRIRVVLTEHNSIEVDVPEDIPKVEALMTA
jgi:3-deoxy-manno-octulosonate cytidylyltransferase (CMP-KDO synthetase)